MITASLRGRASIAARRVTLASTMFAMALAGCGARTELADGGGGGGAGPLSTTTDASDASSTSAVATTSSSSGGLVQCACADKPGYEACPMPLACCACNDDGLGWSVDRCRDPATFNCSCGNVLMCPP